MVTSSTGTNINYAGSDINAALEGFILGAGCSESLRPDHGLVVSSPAGNQIVEGERLAILAPGKIPFIDINLFLIQENSILGIIRLGQPRQISYFEFLETELEHHVSEKAWAKKWGGCPIWYHPVFLVFEFWKPFQKSNAGSIDKTPFITKDVLKQFKES